jgi:magnesium transporter/zinc transporter
MRFDEDGAATLVTPPEAPPLETFHGGFVWIHLNVADLRYRDWVAAQKHLPEEARELLVEPESHLRLSVEEQALYGVLSDFGRALEHDEEVLRQLRIVVTDRCVVTARRYAVESTAEVRQAALGGRRMTAPIELFEALVEYVLEAMDRSIETLIGKFNEIEDRVLDDEARDERRALGALRRRSIRLHRDVADAQRVFARADQSPRGSHETHEALQRLSQRLDSLHQELQATQERARLLQDEIVSNLTSETNRQLYILTILGTLLIPPTLVTGFFGMNTKNLVFAENDNGTLYAALICVLAATAALLTLVWIRKPRD